VECAANEIAASDSEEAAMSQFRGLLMIAAALLTASCGYFTGIMGYPDDYYLLGRSRSPYTGRVIDAETRQPLEGAVVVARWNRDTFGWVANISKHQAAREVRTDRDGRFVIEARTLERWAPRRTKPPEITILAFGYGFFPRFQTHPRDFTGSALFANGKGTTIQLRRLDPKERRDQISMLDPFGLSPRPFKDIPQFMQLVNQESEAVGLEPLSPPEKR
jgi:hypothetical protein